MCKQPWSMQINTWLHGWCWCQGFGFWCWCQGFGFSRHGMFFDEYRLLRRVRIHHQPVPWGPWCVFHPMDFCMYLFLRWSRSWSTPRVGRTSFPLSSPWDSGTPEIWEEQLQVKTEHEKRCWVPQPSPFWSLLILHLIYWGNSSGHMGCHPRNNLCPDPTAWTACGAGRIVPFCSCQTSPAVHSKRQTWIWWRKLREGHRDALRAEAPPLHWRWAERDKGIQPREEKAPGRFLCSPSAPFKEGLEERERPFTKACRMGEGALLLNCCFKEGSFRSDLRKRFFTMREVKHWNMTRWSVKVPSNPCHSIPLWPRVNELCTFSCNCWDWPLSTRCDQPASPVSYCVVIPMSSKNKQE